MKHLALTALISALMIACPVARADSFALTPPDADLGDLDHYRSYTWGIDTPWQPGEQEIVSATLSFRQIRDWTYESNVLYVHLLEDGPLGVTTTYDGQGGGDSFAGQGIVLTIYQDVPPTPQDLSYTFAADQLALLGTYAADGRFALGFDPDCHFYNSGVQLQIVTQTGDVPEPTVVVMLGLSGAAALIRRRRRLA